MTRRTRRIIFYTLILIFVLAAPATILFASGYYIDWQNWRIFKTGSFYFASLPDEAQISINGKIINNTPSYLGRYLPNKYQVQITKPGYIAWQKELKIQEQITTEARNIFLISENLQPVFVTDEATSTKEYFLTAEQIRINQQAEKTATSTLKDLTGWTVFSNNIYYIQKSNRILYKTNLTGTGKEQLSLEPLPEAKTAYEIIISPEQIAVFEPSGKLYLLDQKTKIFSFLADNVIGAEFSTDNEKILFFTDHEIWVLWLKDVFSQPYRIAGEKELITRYAENINQAIWLTQTNEHIIYTVSQSDGQNLIKLTELDSRDQRNTYNIYSAQNPEIYYNELNNLLYFLSAGKMFSIDLIPNN